VQTIKIPKDIIKNMRKTPDDELRKASEHLYYEIWMLNETVKISCPDNPVINNCIIESFGIHARCIRDFLFNTSAGKDDVLAIDYFDNTQEWRQYINKKTAALNKINKIRRVNKELVHLTYTRTDIKPDEKGWEKEEIVKEINALFKQFLKRVPKGRICDMLISFEKAI